MLLYLNKIQYNTIQAKLTSDVSSGLVALILSSITSLQHNLKCETVNIFLKFFSVLQ